MGTREIITELEEHQLLELINQIDKDGNKTMLLKFSAEWCKPCKTVAQLCDHEFGRMPDNVVIASIDIDDSLDLYMMLKKKRMLTGIPCILSWYPLQDRDQEMWYIPDDSVLSSSQPDHISFFKRALAKAEEIKHT
mgnify:CR=1 FL=1